MAQHYFAVVHLNKRKILLLAFISVLILALVIIMAGSLMNLSFGGEKSSLTTIEFQKVIGESDFNGDLHALFPRYFIAGGISYDNSILGQHGIEALADNGLNHFEQVGIYTLKSEVQEIRYLRDQNRVQIIVDPQEGGYNLISFNKGVLNEGPITYEFINMQGQRISVEEDYVYSVPVEYVVLEEGDNYTTATTLDRFVIVDNEVKPVLASYGYDTQILEGASKDIVSLYLFGAKVETVQKQGDTLRIYFNDSEGYQLINFETDRLRGGQNVVKFIREKDLREIDILSFWINN